MDENTKMILDRLDAIQATLSAHEKHFQKIEKHLDLLDFQFEHIDSKFDEQKFQIQVLAHDTKRGFHKLNDEMETVIVALQGEGILPECEP